MIGISGLQTVSTPEYNRIGSEAPQVQESNSLAVLSGYLDFLLYKPRKVCDLKHSTRSICFSSR